MWRHAHPKRGKNSQRTWDHSSLWQICLLGIIHKMSVENNSPATACVAGPTEHSTSFSPATNKDWPNILSLKLNNAELHVLSVLLKLKHADFSIAILQLTSADCTLACFVYVFAGPKKRSGKYAGPFLNCDFSGAKLHTSYLHFAR